MLRRGGILKPVLTLTAPVSENLYIVKTLKEFQYVDEEGKDQGANGESAASRFLSRGIRTLSHLALFTRDAED